MDQQNLKYMHENDQMPQALKFGTNEKPSFPQICTDSGKLEEKTYYAMSFVTVYGIHREAKRKNGTCEASSPRRISSRTLGAQLAMLPKET